MRAAVDDRRTFSLEKARRIAHGGRRPRQLAGSYVSDLVALGKAVMLCPSCEPKFDAARANYVSKPNIPFARGTCDGCRRFSQRARLLVKQDVPGL